MLRLLKDNTQASQASQAKQDRDKYQIQAEIIISGLKIQQIVNQKEADELRCWVDSIIKQDKRENTAEGISHFVTLDLMQLKEKAEMDLHIKKQFIIASELIDQLSDYLTPEAIANRYKVLDKIFNNAQNQKTSYSLNIYVRDLRSELKNAETIFRQADMDESVFPEEKPSAHYSLHKYNSRMTVSLFFRQSSETNVLIEQKKRIAFAGRGCLPIGNQLIFNAEFSDDGLDDVNQLQKKFPKYF